MNQLTAEQIAELLKPKRGKRRGQTRTAEELQTDLFDVRIEVEPMPCSGCGVLRNQDGYCVNPNCEVDAAIPTYACHYCGHCSTPNKCVSSVECPLCISPPGELCRARGTFTSYHEDRWLVVKKLHGTYYKRESNENVRILQQLGLWPE
jgi:hypothetical protein